MIAINIFQKDRQDFEPLLIDLQSILNLKQGGSYDLLNHQIEKFAGIQYEVFKKSGFRFLWLVFTGRKDKAFQEVMDAQEKYYQYGLILMNDLETIISGKMINDAFYKIESTFYERLIEIYNS